MTVIRYLKKLQPGSQWENFRDADRRDNRENQSSNRGVPSRWLRTTLLVACSFKATPRVVMGCESPLRSTKPPCIVSGIICISHGGSYHSCQDWIAINRATAKFGKAAQLARKARLWWTIGTTVNPVSQQHPPKTMTEVMTQVSLGNPLLKGSLVKSISMLRRLSRSPDIERRQPFCFSGNTGALLFDHGWRVDVQFIGSKNQRS